ncbi:hypothetical protein D1164_02095 [Mariniphaga sediminis]|uniref:Uncharacterized protein n=1 Tax=Mariniphaga sediminis TaxID=1628158 RepID=A0A399D6Z3_9BACT|nr:hypothetical protein D1164_02095 [Mariniphaga sediminis]
MRTAFKFAVKDIFFSGNQLPVNSGSSFTHPGYSCHIRLPGDVCFSKMKRFLPSYLFHYKAEYLFSGTVSFAWETVSVFV